jgi:hypothetical protein
LDRAAAEGRDLTTDEKIAFDFLVADIADLDGRIAERESLRKLAE